MEAEQTSYYDIAPEHKIYKATMIRVATFLGGPLVAGYLIAENSKAIGEHEKVKAIWIYAIAAFIVVLAISFLMPSTSGALRYALPLAYSWLAYYLVQHYQGTQIDSFTSTGGQIYSWWRAIGISLIGVVITLVLLFIVLVALGIQQ